MEYPSCTKIGLRYQPFRTKALSFNQLLEYFHYDVRRGHLAQGTLANCAQRIKKKLGFPKKHFIYLYIGISVTALWYFDFYPIQLNYMLIGITQRYVSKTLSSSSGSKIHPIAVSCQCCLCNIGLAKNVVRLPSLLRLSIICYFLFSVRKI